MREKLLDLLCRYMRDNLLFTGIQENIDPNTEDRETVLRSFLKKHVQNNPTMNTDGQVTVSEMCIDLEARTAKKRVLLLRTLPIRNRANKLEMQG